MSPFSFARVRHVFQSTSSSLWKRKISGHHCYLLHHVLWQGPAHTAIRSHMIDMAYNPFTSVLHTTCLASIDLSSPTPQKPMPFFIVFFTPALQISFLLNSYRRLVDVCHEGNNPGSSSTFDDHWPSFSWTYVLCPPARPLLRFHVIDDDFTCQLSNHFLQGRSFCFRSWSSSCPPQFAAHLVSSVTFSQPRPFSIQHLDISSTWRKREREWERRVTHGSPLRRNWFCHPQELPEYQAKHHSHNATDITRLHPNTQGTSSSSPEEGDHLTMSSCIIRVKSINELFNQTPGATFSCDSRHSYCLKHTACV